MRILLGVLVAVAALVTPLLSQAQESPARASGTVLDWGQDDRQIWFEFGRSRRFLISRAALADPAAALAVIERAAETQRLLVVDYDGEAGDVLAKPARVVFHVMALTFDGGALPAEPAAAADRRPSGARADLAHAMVLRDAGDRAGAKTFLDRAIGSGELPRPLQAMALKGRASVIGGPAESMLPLGDPEGDRRLVAAVADFSAAAELTPDDSQLFEARAAALVGLGAYDEAIAAYRILRQRWPERGFWSWISIGAIHRRQDEPRVALADLDEIPAAEADGMAYHYHRGWTLLDLGRANEAAQEFTLGIEGQSDYPWAYARRACAYAALGHLEDALADQDEASRQLSVHPDANPTAEAAWDARRATEAAAEIKAAIGRGERTLPAKRLCAGYWPNDIVRRDRSPLLPRGGP